MTESTVESCQDVNVNCLAETWLRGGKSQAREVAGMLGEKTLSAFIPWLGLTWLQGDIADGKQITMMLPLHNQCLWTTLHAGFGDETSYCP